MINTTKQLLKILDELSRTWEQIDELIDETDYDWCYLLRAKMDRLVKEYEAVDSRMQWVAIQDPAPIEPMSTAEVKELLTITLHSSALPKELMIRIFATLGMWLRIVTEHEKIGEYAKKGL